MYEQHGQCISSLQLTQISQQRGDLTAGIFIDAVQAHERIQYQQAGLQPLHGSLQAASIGGLVDA
jgi:hypothetical protein